MSDDGEFPQSYEILEMIFKHLPGELNKLKKVCKRFHEVIISSMPLMQRVTEKWHSLSGFCFWADNHKLYNVELALWKWEYSFLLTRFIQMHAHTIKTVELNITPLEYPDIHQILSLLSGSLEDLIFCFKTPNALEPPKIRMNKLRSLTLGPESSNIFTKAGANFGIVAENLKAFTYKGYIDSNIREELPDIMIYLRNQPQLEDLNLTRLAARKFLRESEAESFPFQLKKAAFEFYPTTYNSDNVQMVYPFDDTYTVQFIPRFIEQQQDTLRHLILKDVVLKDNEVIVMLTSKLTKVELLSVDVQCFENSGIGNTSIESLVLGEPFESRFPRAGNLPEDLLYCFFQNCKGLQSLEIKHIELDYWWSLVLADMEMLTYLKLNKCDFKPLPLKAIETLEILTRSEHAADWVAAFVLMNPTLDTVNVPCQYQQDELFLAVSGNLDVKYNLNGAAYRSEPQED